MEKPILKEAELFDLNIEAVASIHFFIYKAKDEEERKIIEQGNAPDDLLLLMATLKAKGKTVDYDHWRCATGEIVFTVKEKYAL